MSFAKPFTPRYKHSRPQTRKPLASLCCGIIFCLIGCGQSGTKPLIVSQPNNATTPLGQTATFTTYASGTAPLSYQWSKDGKPVAGANQASYITPDVTAADAGSTYAVTVSNGAGTASSMPATLSVGPRSPLPGDLRFQQVSAASTLPGYQEDELTTIGSAGPIYAAYTDAIGTPLLMAQDCGVPPDGCEWRFGTFFLPPGVTGLTISYTEGHFADFAKTLAALPGTSTVLTSLDLEAQNLDFAFSAMQSAQSSGFDAIMKTISPGDLATAASTEGAQGRVITAVSYDNGQVTYVSYGWTGNGPSLYDTEVLTGGPTTLGSTAQTLADGGYIISAFGSDQSGNFIMIGTKVVGDQIPRPLLIIAPGASPVPISDDGYATVAYTGVPTSGYPMWIAEK